MKTQTRKRRMPCDDGGGDGADGSWKPRNIQGRQPLLEAKNRQARSHRRSTALPTP